MTYYTWIIFLHFILLIHNLFLWINLIMILYQKHKNRSQEMPPAWLLILCKVLGCSLKVFFFHLWTNKWRTFPSVSRMLVTHPVSARGPWLAILSSFPVSPLFILMDFIFTTLFQITGMICSNLCIMLVLPLKLYFLPVRFLLFW